MGKSSRALFRFPVTHFSSLFRFSKHPLHRGLFVEPIVNRCLFRGKSRVRTSMTFLTSSLFSLIRLRASLFDATGNAHFVCLHRLLFFHSIWCFRRFSLTPSYIDSEYSVFQRIQVLFRPIWIWRKKNPTKWKFRKVEYSLVYVTLLRKKEGFVFSSICMFVRKCVYFIGTS